MNNAFRFMKKMFKAPASPKMPKTNTKIIVNEVDTTFKVSLYK